MALDGILQPMTFKFNVVYQNHIVIHIHTVAQHVIHVLDVLPLLTVYGLKAKYSKCTWTCQIVDYESFAIDQADIITQEHKPYAVMDCVHPEYSAHVRGFLSLTS
jgi:hypothetical protein